MLVVSRNYPNSVLPARGLWVERLSRAAQAFADVTVIAPVPHVPLTLSLPSMIRQHRVPARRHDGGIEVWHPRTFASMAHQLYAADARLELPSVRRLADRLHEARPFDLVHAHFVYPDGVVAARLGRRYGIPVVVSEHAFWHTWVQSHPDVWRQVREVLPDIDVVAGVSEAVRADVASLVGGQVRTAVLPNVVDDETFHGPAPDETWDPDLLLFVGMVRHVKGLDVLARALALAVKTRPALRLRVLGSEGFMRRYRRDEEVVRELLAQLGVASRVEWSGMAAPDQVAAEMRRAGAVIVPSRRESFSSVAVEALASGTPVVATRCGGPEEFLTPALGRLVPTEDPHALAAAILDVLERRGSFDRQRLHAAAAERFGMRRSEARVRALYEEAIGRSDGGP